MLKAEFLKCLPNGQLVSENDVLSPFIIYTYTFHPGLYILVPKPEQRGLQNIAIVCNQNGIRVINYKGWPQSLASKIATSVACNSDGNFKQEGINHIPTDVRDVICEQLIKKIQYQNITI